MDQIPHPFPRTADGLPNAWTGDDGRFSPVYESRAERLWHAVLAAGYQPSINYAGSEDGESLLVCDQQDTLVMLIHLEDPNEQAIIDQRLAEGSVAKWIGEGGNT